MARLRAQENPAGESNRVKRFKVFFAASRSFEAAQGSGDFAGYSSFFDGAVERTSRSMNIGVRFLVWSISQRQQRPPTDRQAD